MLLFDIIYAILTDGNGSFWRILFYLVAIVFLFNCLVRTGIFQILIKTTLFFLRMIAKTFILLCNTILFTYSFVMLYLYCKEKECKMRGFIKNRTFNAFGLKFVNQMGETIELTHPKHIKKVLNIFYKLVGVVRQVFINFDKAFKIAQKM